MGGGGAKKLEKGKDTYTNRKAARTKHTTTLDRNMQTTTIEDASYEPTRRPKRT